MTQQQPDAGEPTGREAAERRAAARTGRDVEGLSPGCGRAGLGAPAVALALGLTAVAFAHAYAVYRLKRFLLARAGALEGGFLERALEPRLAPLAYAGLALAQRVLPDPALERALDALKGRTRWYQRFHAGRIDARRVLAPEWDDGSHRPWLRFVSTSSARDFLDLVRESASLPGGPAEKPMLSGRRVWGLLWRHALSRNVYGTE